MTYQAAQPIITVEIRDEAGVVAARQRARQLASLAGFPVHDQVRIATAVSETSRIVLQRGGGSAQFAVSPDVSPQSLVVRISHSGPALDPYDPALTAGRRLLDRVEVVAQPPAIVLIKALAPDNPRINPAIYSGPLLPQPAATGESTSRELLELLDTLRMRELELEKRHAEVRRLSIELEETNRGVVALYAELDEKAAALRSADELKGRFLRHVSHEFRTPLNSIAALAQLLLRRTDGELNEEQERQVGYIRQASQDLTEMVNDLLDLAKVESGVTEVHHGPISLGHLFRGLRGVMRPLVGDASAVNLVFEEPQEDLVFLSDETKAAQILRNLISNALKFTERGEVRVSYSVTDSWLLIHVADTGVGIAPADQERIFLEFTQVNNPIQRRVKGTGLGLPLSRKLAYLLGGDLTVTSTPGEGSRFTLKLPLRSPSAELGDAGPILIIDDDESARYIARQRFRGTRHRWIEATGGHEGAERARFERPILILLDLRMPDRGGFEVLDDLKSDPSTQDIPVIIHTSRVLGAADHERLGNRQAAILPKGEAWPSGTLDMIRNLLHEPDLFEAESGSV